MKIGIFGGTFDPFTVAHKAIVKEVLKQKLVDKVLIAPSFVNYYRTGKEEWLTFPEKCRVIEECTDLKNERIYDGDNVPVQIYYGDWDLYNRYCQDEVGEEWRRGRRFYHTLCDIVAKYDPSNEYYVIIGSDQYAKFKTWFNYERILEMAKLIVVDGRDGEKAEVKDIPAQFIWIHPCYEKVNASELREKYMDWERLEPGKKFTYDVKECHIKDYIGEFKMLEKNIVKDFEKEMEGWVRKETVKTASEQQQEVEVAVDGAAASGQAVHGAELLCHTPIFDVKRRAEVKPGFRPVVVDAPNWVTIIVENERGLFLMEKQRRWGSDTDVVEFPCGTVEKGEEPFDAAVRELEEETGIKLDNPKRDMIRLGEVDPNPAFMTNMMYIYYVKVVADENFEQVGVKFDENEYIKTGWFYKDEAFYDSNICGATVPVIKLAAQYMYERRFGKLKG